MKWPVFVLFSLFFLLSVGFAFAQSLDAHSLLPEDIDEGEEVVVHFVDGYDKSLFTSSASSQKTIRSSHISGYVVGESIRKNVTRTLRNSNAVVGRFSQEELQGMVDAGIVKTMYENKKISIALDSAREQINATFTHNIDFNGLHLNGTGQTVCVIDTGIDDTHPALAQAVIGQYNYINDTYDAHDDNGHGTHVAGIIASRNETYRGIAYGANLYVMKVLGSDGDGTFADLEEALTDCYNNATALNITVVSMSLGDGGSYDAADNCNTHPSFVDTYIDLLVAENISVVVASGNEDFEGGISFPACVASATAVGSVNDADSPSGFSNVGDLLDLFAPGVGIISTATTGDGSSDDCDSNDLFYSCTGTSMATPMVSGAFAVIQQFLNHFRNESITPSNITAIFNDTGVPITDAGETQGRIDLWSAYESLLVSSPTLTFASPTLADGSYTNDTLTINVTVQDAQTVEYCYVRINGTNYPMTNSGGTNATCILTINLTHGNRNYTVYAVDSDGEANYTKRSVIINAEPAITPEIGVINVSENITLLVNHTTTDADNDTLTYSWLMNGTEVSTAINMSYALNFTSAGSWNLTLRVNDGFENVTNYWSLNITDLNRVPEVNVSATLNPITTDDLDCNVSASDPDTDNTISTLINWYVNGTVNATFENDTVMNATYTTGGDTWLCEVIVTDSLNASTTVNTTFLITNVGGNVSSINSTNALRMRINGSTNISQFFTGTYTVNITDTSDNPLLSFDWNFSSSPLHLNFTLQYSSATKSIYVHNLDLPIGVTKSLYLPKSGLSYVCILDNATALPGDISSSCTAANETKITCPNTVNNYTCSTVGDYYKISNLSNTVVKGTATTPGGSGGGGGGGGGGSSTTTTVTTTTVECREDWICDIWSACNNGVQTRECFDANACGTEERMPPLELACTEPIAVEEPMQNLVEESAMVDDTEQFSSDEQDETSYLYLLVAAMIVLVAAILLTTTSHTSLKK